ncbi:hypothetical protein GF373_05385 [bacterium]|nr:hypothetical protein [bacterium]
MDQEKNTHYVYPRPNDKLSQANIVGTHLHELIKLRGSVNHPVQNIHFKGLRFAHTSRVFMQPYERLLRGDWSIARLAAVHLQGTEECSIQDCLFENLGGNAVFLNQYTRRASILGNHFTHVGESAVCVVGNVEAVRSPAISYSNTLPQDEIDLTPGPKGKNYPADCLIKNNLIHHIGIVGKQTAGVFLSMSQDITVSHNTIFNCPRAAICINDGCWGGHIIEYNDAFQTVRETGDHGPFNSWGRDRFWKTSYNGGRDLKPVAKERALLDNIKTTHIRYNRFTHDHGHSWGIDLDDGSSNYHVYKNLCIGMGVKLREGYFRKVENNIIIDGFGGFHIWLPGCDDIIARNIFVSAKPYQFIRANPEYAKTIDYNLFYNQGEMPVITGVGDPPRRMTLREWREKGFDRHSILADPKFISPRTGNYKVQDDSPAHKRGFENFPMNRFGVYKKEFTQQIAPIERRFLPQKSKLQPNPARETNRRMWNGATIKNLRGEAEKSAAGMGEETGVFFVNVPQQSQAAQWGFKEGDVLTGWNQEKIHSVSDLLRQDKQKTNQPIKITVFNATERIIQIRH